MPHHTITPSTPLQMEAKFTDEQRLAVQARGLMFEFACGRCGQQHKVTIS
jgi:hypothetical protein